MTPLIVKNADRLSQTAVFHDTMTPVLYRLITIWPVLDRSSLHGYHTKTRFSFSHRSPPERASFRFTSVRFRAFGLGFPGDER